MPPTPHQGERLPLLWAGIEPQPLAIFPPSLPATGPVHSPRLSKFLKLYEAYSPLADATSTRLSSTGRVKNAYLAADNRATTGGKFVARL